jgi:hypothetical protein
MKLREDLPTAHHEAGRWIFCHVAKSKDLDIVEVSASSRVAPSKNDTEEH